MRSLRRFDGFKHAADFVEIDHVARLSPLYDLIHKSRGFGIEAGLGRIVRGIENFDHHFDRVATALHPSLATLS